MNLEAKTPDDGLVILGPTMGSVVNWKRIIDVLMIGHWKDPIKIYTQKLRDKYRGYARDKFNEFGYRLPENHLDIVMMLMVDAYLDGLYHKHP